MAVIWIFSASSAPITEPARIAAKISAKAWVPEPSTLRSSSVATTATSMPTAPMMLARTAVFGCDSPFRPRMNRTEATR